MSLLNEMSSVALRVSGSYAEHVVSRVPAEHVVSRVPAEHVVSLYSPGSLLLVPP